MEQTKWSNFRTWYCFQGTYLCRWPFTIPIYCPAARCIVIFPKCIEAKYPHNNNIYTVLTSNVLYRHNDCFPLWLESHASFFPLLDIQDMAAVRPLAVWHLVKRISDLDCREEWQIFAGKRCSFLLLLFSPNVLCWNSTIFGQEMIV